MNATQIIVSLYRERQIALDRLPYTPHMDRLVEQSVERGLADIDARRIWTTLARERKDGRLPRVGRGANNRVSLPPRDIVLRCHAVIGTPIDRLPYSPEMDRLAAMVREAAPGLITHWQIWWGLLDARKGAAKLRRRRATNVM